MRDKIVFFVLGAVLATIAYTIGDLETLTAEDEIIRLDHLLVNRLQVKEDIIVGDIGTRPILIKSTNELAEIAILGGEISKIDAIREIDTSPTISLQAKSNGVLIRAASHSERPEATCTLVVANMEGEEFESGLILTDLKGTKGIFPD